MKQRSLLLLLADLLFRRIFQDEGVQPVAHVNSRISTAGLALQLDGLALDFDDCLRVEAVITLHILLDEVLQQLHQLLCVMRAIDNGGASLLVKISLCTQLTAVELQNVCSNQSRLSSQSRSISVISCSRTGN